MMEMSSIESLKTLSKEVCSRCNALDGDGCFDCKIHKLINQILKEIT